jgi:hypothetical protein
MQVIEQQNASFLKTQRNHRGARKKVARKCEKRAPDRGKTVRRHSAAGKKFSSPLAVRASGSHKMAG